MARIAAASVDAVKAAADMVDLVSARTTLRKQGARFTGRCPFHEERTPSFSVNPVDKLFYCFGCGKGGDLITFVRETEQLDFAEAIEWLAERFNVALEYEEPSPHADAQRRRRDRLHAALDSAASFYERYLWESQAGGKARDYLAGRGLSEETCREFRLGLALGGQTLARRALERGYTDAELAAAGLVNRRGNDYFQGRLIFPLADARGRVVAFGARKLREDDPLHAKYVNSPEGELFHKASVVYGLHLARQAIAKQDRAVVVEGYTDVMALRQAGLEPVVASMGTALTQLQLRELSRLTRRLFLCFDADAAGESATLRGMELAAEQGFDVRVVPLPPGLDPADVPDRFDELLSRAETYIGYRVRLEIARAEDRQEAFVRVREILGRFEDSPERQEALRFAADRLDLPKETQAGLAPRARASTGTISPKLLEASDRLERDALAGVLAHPELRRVLAELGPEHFDAELHQRLRDQLLGHEPPEAELVSLLAELDARAAAAGIDEETAKQLLLRLRERRLRRDLQAADEEHFAELQHKLAEVRTAIREFA
jgi:DNA primase